ncbi:hypothetical protein QF000_005808 [Paraburkholderia atlantica]
MTQWHRERQQRVAVDDAPDDVRSLVAIKQRRQHVNLEIRRFVEHAECFANRLHHTGDVARQILERRIELEVRDHPLQRCGKSVRAGVIRAIGRLRGRFVVLDVFGRNRRAHENEIVVEVRAVQDLAGNRIKEGFRALGLTVRGQKADVVQLDLLPHFAVDVLRVVFVFELVHAFLHAIVVRRDAVARELLQAVPVADFEQRLRMDRRIAKDPVVTVEPFEHRLRDVETDLRR